MNMLKRSLAMLLVLTLLFSFVPFSVFADDGESAETTAVTEAVEQRSGGPGNSDFGHSQGNGEDKHKDPKFECCRSFLSLLTYSYSVTSYPIRHKKTIIFLLSTPWRHVSVY